MLNNCLLNSLWAVFLTVAGNKKALENSRVVRVEYENGEGYFLNYNADYDVTVVYNGKTFVIPALGYAAYDNL